jgi:hypothetical protein
MRPLPMLFMAVALAMTGTAAAQSTDPGMLKAFPPVSPDQSKRWYDEWNAKQHPTPPKPTQQPAAATPDPNRPDLNPNIQRSLRAQSGELYKPAAPAPRQFVDASGKPFDHSGPDPMRYTPQGKRAVDAQGRNVDQIKAAGGGDDEEARVTKREEMLDRLAFKRFPQAYGGADQREAYKAQLRKHLYDLDEAAQGNSYSVRIKR